jgi:hypothetical protein
MKGFMYYTTEMGSVVMIYNPSFIKTASGSGNTDIHTG